MNRIFGENNPAIDIDVSTDVATLMFFHPEDLKHAEHWPIAWYSEPGVWQHESKDEQLVAWGAGNDGSYRVRLRCGPITRSERALAHNSWVFPYEVRHGRVFIDNSDCLPGVDRMEDAFASENEGRWFNLPNGRYLATVYSVSAENQPDYIVSFVAQNDDVMPLIAYRPPLISRDPSIDTNDAPEFIYKPPQDVAPDHGDTDFSEPLPAGVSSSIKPPGMTFSSKAESALNENFDGGRMNGARRVRYIIAPKIEVGQMAAICKMTATLGGRDFPRTHRMQTLGIARIDEIVTSVPPEETDYTTYKHNYHTVRATPIHTSHGNYDHIDVDDIRRQIIESLSSGQLSIQQPELALYNLRRVSKMEHLMELLQFLTSVANIDSETSIKLGLMNVTENISVLTECI